MEQLSITAQERKVLEVKERAIKDALLAEMKREKLSRQESNFGTFTIAHRSSYIYTPAVKTLEDSVKILKDEEQKKGLAEEKITEYILFKEVKE